MPQSRRRSPPGGYQEALPRANRHGELLTLNIRRGLSALPVGGGAGLASAGVAGAPAATAWAAEVQEQQAALGAGALAQSPGVRGSEQADGVTGHRAQRAGCRIRPGRSQQHRVPLHARHGRWRRRRPVDDLLVGTGRRLSAEERLGGAVDRFAHGPRFRQVAPGHRDRSAGHGSLRIPAGQVIWGEQPLEAAAPPLTDGRAERQAQPPGPEDEPQFLRRRLTARDCRKPHVTSITSDVRPEPRQIQEFLLDHGAGRLPHPGGSLYEHLVRVAALLAEWGADEDLQLAGLCHACYGTAGYPHLLLGPDERPVLRAVAGAPAESLAYLYGSCDRAAVHPALKEPGPVPFRDRFTGRTHTPPEPDIRAFTELTAANELDVIRHNPAMATSHGVALRQFFAGARQRLTDAAWQAWSQPPGPDLSGRIEAGGQMSPVAITGLDHLVLTVADLDQTAGFYQRVLGMRPVTFGAGRRALEFGTSKINLHQAGQEITPHAAQPTRGSADLCLITTTPPGEVLAHLGAEHVPVEDAPVPRTGACGPITSIYIRDPDGNLIEIASYAAGQAS